METGEKIDFGKMRVLVIFRKMFYPTLLGMLATSAMSVADGIFVGQGVGSDALAAINIASPLFMVATGISLMFGSGASVLASIHQSQNNDHQANVCITQAFTFSLVLMSIVVAVLECFPDKVAMLLGSSERLLPLVNDYFLYIVPGLMMNVLFCIGMYVIRLDGSPIFAMLCNALPAVMNFVLDYVFVFPLQMGIKGAGLASFLSDVLGGGMVVYYMFCRAERTRLCRPDFSKNGIVQTISNGVHMGRLGFSSMIGELAVSVMMIEGNYVYMAYLSEDGVAAFSVACYVIPVVTMLANAISSSAQPIISYNYGVQLYQRIRKTSKIALSVAISSGLALTLLGVLFSPAVVGMFVDNQTETYRIAVEGFPLCSLSFVLLSLNLVLIGIFQSIESVRPANIFTLLRGFIFILPAFALLPLLIGIPGLWLAQPLAEFLTLLVILIYVAKNWKKLMGEI